MRLFYGGVSGLVKDDLISGRSACATTSRLYAKFHAALCNGDLYQVEAVDDALVRSPEDSIATWRGTTLRIVAVLDRGVELTWAERQRLVQQWLTADVAARRVHPR